MYKTSISKAKNCPFFAHLFLSFFVLVRLKLVNKSDPSSAPCCPALLTSGTVINRSRIFFGQRLLVSLNPHRKSISCYLTLTSISQKQIMTYHFLFPLFISRARLRLTMYGNRSFILPVVRKKSFMIMKTKYGSFLMLIFFSSTQLFRYPFAALDWRNLPSLRFYFVGIHVVGFRSLLEYRQQNTR